MIKIIKYFLLIFLLSITFGCASDRWYNQKERERVIRLSPKEREEIRQRCKHCADFIYKKPTPEEIERLKNQDSWRNKIRSWYYRVW
jgi:hypothetical protein